MQIRLTFIKYLKQVKIEFESCYIINTIMIVHVYMKSLLVHVHVRVIIYSLDLIFIEVVNLI